MGNLPLEAPRLVDPVARCLTPEFAQRLLAFRVEPSEQVRLDDLASRNTEGALSEAERDEYAAYVRGMTTVTLLQFKARALLGIRPNSAV